MDEIEYSNPALEHYECDGQISIYDLFNPEEIEPNSIKIIQGTE